MAARDLALIRKVMLTQIVATLKTLRVRERRCNSQLQA
jgi:hypothetical protein